MNCPYCDSSFDNHVSHKCETCNLCVTCCYIDNHGICSPEEIAEYETWKTNNETDLNHG